MQTQILTRNQQLIDRYLDQPSTMPKRVRTQIEEAWNGQPVLLYAIADLDASLSLTRTWVALGKDMLALVQEGKSEGEDSVITHIPRNRIKEVRERTGLSSVTVILQEDPDGKALAVFSFTHRQRRAMGAILFVLRDPSARSQLSTDAGNAVYAESVSEPIRKAQASVVTNRLAVFWRLLRYLAPYRVSFALGVVSASLLTLVSLVPPRLTGHLIDDVVWPFERGELSAEAALSMGWRIFAVVVVVLVAKEFFLWLRLRTMTRVGEYVARDLRTSVYDHLHKLSVNYFSSQNTGSIISRVSSDTDRIWDFIAFGVAEMTLSVLMVLGLGGVLIWYDWRLGLVITLPVPIIFACIYLMGRHLHATFLRIWHKWSEMTAVLSDTIPGIRVVKAFHQEDYERDRFGKRNQEVADEACHVHDIWTTYWPIIYFGISVMNLLVWAFALPRLLGYGTPLSPGLFVTFLLYMGMFIAPIENFGFLTRMINRSLSSAHRVFEVLDTEPEVRESDEAVTLAPVKGHIIFEDVVFGYDPVRHIIRDVSFEVQPGEMIGLVGPSGSGKTTIINLIARFYDVVAGRIVIDGVDIQDLEIGAYREQIGMVMQDPYLFQGSILNNIRYGAQGAPTDKVLEAARAANAHDFVCALPQGYDTIVGERGHTLSGGERQRISIARAILHNPRILILDEATSSVDTETERKIQEAIERLIEGRTVIAIAHRLSTLRKADRLFVMKEGELAEQGTHEELLANPEGIYKKLFELQRELHEMYAF
jgi:ATP-binding cassette subfamily B protein